MFCEFHREKAWNRNLKSESEEVRELFDSIAKAADERELEECIHALKSSHKFTGKIRIWFEQHWLAYKEVITNDDVINSGLQLSFFLEMGTLVSAAKTTCSLDYKWC